MFLKEKSHSRTTKEEEKREEERKAALKVTKHEEQEVAPPPMCGAFLRAEEYRWMGGRFSKFDVLITWGEGKERRLRTCVWGFIYNMDGTTARG